MSITKKFWQITGTNEFSEEKESLKPRRAELNKQAGIDEKGVEEKFVPAEKWPFKITKGPDHPKYAD